MASECTIRWPSAVSVWVVHRTHRDGLKLRRYISEVLLGLQGGWRLAMVERRARAPPRFIGLGLLWTLDIGPWTSSIGQHSTVMVPRMPDITCGMQMYLYSPATVNVWEYESPGWSISEPHGSAPAGSWIYSG